MSVITPEQSRTARTMLGWTVNYVTRIAGVAPSSFYAWENEYRTLGWNPRRYLRATYESGGLSFGPDGAVGWASGQPPPVGGHATGELHP